MKASNRSAFKLILILALACVYTFVSFADTNKPASTPPPATASNTPAHGATTDIAPPAQATAPCDPTAQKTSLFGMTAAEAECRSIGCVSCHKGIEDIHNCKVNLGCIDCHGGHAEVRRPDGVQKGSAEYQALKEKAHVLPGNASLWKTAANPERSYAQANKETPEFMRFVNPGDLRVAAMSCGTSECHTREVHNVGKSLMTTGTMLWGAALYNNGSYPFKNSRWGESISPDGQPQRVITIPQPTAEETQKKGVLPFLDPLPRWEITHMGNILRTFERGGRKSAEVGLPLSEESPGKPTQNLLSPRGLGTLLRTDPVYLGLQKTRLLDPMLGMFGSNDQPGDYRSSGCTGCHVVYANDRDPLHGGPDAEKYGHDGATQTDDIALREARDKGEPGHPVKHQFTRAIPSSQCVVCHMHPGTLVMMSFYGTTWWDLETDGDKGMYPEKHKKPTPAEEQAILKRNPEESALRGNWGSVDFLRSLRDSINPKLTRTQFADFNGHGWVFRDVFKTDRHGNFLDPNGQIVNDVNAAKLKEAVEGPAKDGLPVHLKDIHIEMGMHCVDCHFKQDNHGNGKLYSEVRNAVEIDCVDCHGTITERADPTAKEARMSAEYQRANGGNRLMPDRFTQKDVDDAAKSGNRMLDYRELQSRKDRFFKDAEGHLWQRAAVSKGADGKPVVWRVKQVADTVDPKSADYNEKAALAKTILTDNKTWGSVPADESKLAHANSAMTCYSCHTSWTPSCFGCHLKMKANQERPMLHNEGEEDLRNWTSYNFQTLRDDVFLLGRDGTVTGKRFAPVRSACAILVSSQNQNREWIYSQQQTVSEEGYSGQAFSSHFPHTVRTKETRACVDCHLSEKNDNNAYLAMTYMQGTNFYNWIGRYCYVAAGKEGFEAVVVTERDEPQAVIGSYLHKLAFPEEYEKHEHHERELTEAYEHPGNDIIRGLNPFAPQETEVLNVQLRGEYLYAATGRGGLRVYDVANIDQKGFSERMTTAPFSPLGQRFYVKTKYATAVASPSTLAVDPTASLPADLLKKFGVTKVRMHRPENEEAVNRDDKQPIHPLYAFLYVTDKYEGLITVVAATLLDGVPTNNFLRRALTWNPNGVLNGANNITIAGTHAYITCDRGLVIVDINNPFEPKVVAEVGAPALKNPHAVQIQFRYAFVCDADGVKVVDVTDPAKPRVADGAVVPLAEANNIYLVRTYAYVAAGKQGLAIIDIENPEKPRLEQTFDAGGKINDAHDVKVGMTNVSLFAYIADGHNGLRVVQLTSPETRPTNYGFSPRPTPQLIASAHTKGPALAVSEGIDRDRAIDESGNQLSVFGRRGARPMNFNELLRMYTIDSRLFLVPDIKDRDTKNNGDIRRLYGPPRTMDAAENIRAPRKEEPKKSESSSEEKRTETLNAPPAAIPDGQARLSAPADALAFAALCMPFAFVLFRERRRRKM
ncbi:MAG: hypothetical protein V7641_4369 [Blastocatellia bacterium]